MLCLKTGESRNTGKLLMLVAATLMLIPFLSATAVAQEDADFYSMIDQWNELETKLSAQEALLETNGSDTAVSDKFRDLVDEANALIEKMKGASGEAIASNPGDAKVLKAALGLMVNDARFGRDGEVLKLGDHLIKAKVNPGIFQVARSAPDLSVSARHIFDELGRRSADSEADLPVVKLITTQGEITLMLFEDDAPNAVANFVSLIDAEFYNDILFHRVLEGFVAQGGCPDGTGGGGPGYSIDCECNESGARRHFRGSISMAHAGPDSGGSQFFLCFTKRETELLDRKHTVFGRIIDGWEILDLITRTHTQNPTGGPEIPIPDVVKDRIIRAEVVSRRDHAYVPTTRGGDPLPAKNAANAEEPDAEAPATESPDTDESEDSTDETDAGDAEMAEESSEPTEPAAEEANEEGSKSPVEENGEEVEQEGGDEENSSEESGEASSESGEESSEENTEEGGGE